MELNSLHFVTISSNMCSNVKKNIFPYENSEPMFFRRGKGVSLEEVPGCFSDWHKTVSEW